MDMTECDSKKLLSRMASIICEINRLRSNGKQPYDDLMKLLHQARSCEKMLREINKKEEL